MSKSLKEAIQFISEGGSVVRYHTRPGIKPETVAHHSFEVAMIASMLSPDLPAELLMACLTHDLGEQGVGDIPSPTKWSVDGLKSKLDHLESSVLNHFGMEWESKLTPEQLHVLKLADAFSCMLGCIREVALGNRNALLIWRRINHHVVTSGMVNPGPETTVHYAIIHMYEEAVSESGPNFDVYKR